jgi:hypothetical protein
MLFLFCCFQEWSPFGKTQKRYLIKKIEKISDWMRNSSKLETPVEMKTQMTQCISYIYLVFFILIQIIIFRQLKITLATNNEYTLLLSTHICIYNSSN